MYGRFVRGLPGFLRRRVSVQESRAIIRRRLESREETFLKLASEAVYGRPTSPYLALLRRAGCEFGDLAAQVRRNGLESALRRLHDEGVFVSFEEFKGRKPIIRPGVELITTADDFDNPNLSRCYERESGGTTGRATRVRVDLDHLAAGVPHLLSSFEAHGLVGVPNVLWHGVLPDAIATNEMLRGAQAGILPERWFTPVVPSDLQASMRSRFSTYAIVAAGRLAGVPFPWPEYVSLERADVIARWAADTVRAHGAAVVRTMVSQAVRVALAAEESALDLHGTTFVVFGEPPTPAKVAVLARVGARHVPGYAFSEFGGRVGVGCARPADENDQHLLSDAIAAISVESLVPGTDTAVSAFCFTGLLPSGPKILINVGSDDYGLVEKRACGCPLGELGLTQHLRHIRSFRKLTGEGVTLVGTDLVRILEEVLPAQFGGSPLDYQLAEEEDAQSFTRLILRISPRVGRRDEADIVTAVLDAIGQGGPAGEITRTLWQKAGTLRVEWREPAWTSRGKLMPLHLARHMSAASAIDPSEAHARATSPRS